MTEKQSGRGLLETTLPDDEMILICEICNDKDISPAKYLRDLIRQDLGIQPNEETEIEEMEEEEEYKEGDN